MEGLNIIPSKVVRLVEYADWVTGPVVEGESVTETEDPGEAYPDDLESEFLVISDETLEVEDVSDEVIEFRLVIAEVVIGERDELETLRWPTKEVSNEAEEERHAGFDDG